MKSGKVWGETTALLANPLVELHWLEIDPLSRCSLHLHEHKWNGFLVFSGTLIIDVQQKDYDLTDETHLQPGEFMAVEPGLLHRFRTLEAKVVAVELYWPKLMGGKDIQRVDHGATGIQGNSKGMRRGKGIYPRRRP